MNGVLQHVDEDISIGEQGRAPGANDDAAARAPLRRRGFECPQPFVQCDLVLGVPVDHFEANRFVRPTAAEKETITPMEANGLSAQASAKILILTPVKDADRHLEAYAAPA